jgi:hypothetical protein
VQVDLHCPGLREAQLTGTADQERRSDAAAGLDLPAHLEDDRVRARVTSLLIPSLQAQPIRALFHEIGRWSAEHPEHLAEHCGC